MSPDLRGTLTQWDEEKGEGMIRPDSGGIRLLAREEEFRDTPPKQGTRYYYQKAIDAQGIALAKTLTPVIRSESLKKRKRKRPAKPKRHPIPMLLAVVLYFGLFQLLVNQYMFPVLWLRAQLLFSTFTFLVMALDKLLAVKQRSRVPESTLHVLELIGGWPGGLMAQQVFRHKIRKRSFRRMFLLCVFLNLGLMALLIAPSGSWANSSFDAYVPEQGARIEKALRRVQTWLRHLRSAETSDS